MAKDNWIRFNAEDFARGMGRSPHVGMGEMVGVNIIEDPTVIQCNTALFPISGTEEDEVSDTFTVDTSADTLVTATESLSTVVSVDRGTVVVPADGRPVKLSTTDTLPAVSGTALDTSTVYYIKDVTGTRTYELYRDYSLSTQVDFTDTGTGTHTLTTVDPGAVKSVGVDNVNSDIFFVETATGNGDLWRISWNSGEYYRPEFIDGLPNVSNSNVVYVWKNYVHVFQKANIAAYGPLGGTEAWTNAIDNGANVANSLTNDEIPSAAIGINDVLYFAYNNSIGYIEETAGDDYDPTDTASFSGDCVGITFPEGATINDLDTMQGKVYAACDDGRIYAWDRTSDFFETPIEMPEVIDKIKGVNNLLYCFSKGSGNIYVTNGTTYRKINSIPEYLHKQFQRDSVYNLTFSKPYNFLGRILFAVTDANNVGAVWSLDASTNSLVIDSTSSNRDLGSTSVPYQEFKVVAFTAPGSSGARRAYYAFYTRDNDHFIEKNDTFYADDKYFDTPYVTIGDGHDPVTLSKIEVEVDTELSGSENINVGYRTNLTDSFTDFTAIDPSSGYGTVFTFDIGKISTKTGVQFRIYMGDSTGSARTGIRIKEVRFK